MVIRSIGILRLRKFFFVRLFWSLWYRNENTFRFTTADFLYRNGTNAKQESNPFDEEEWDEDGGEALVDTGEPGVPVRALYDYEGAEADELSFKQGKWKKPQQFSD